MGDRGAVMEAGMGEAPEGSRIFAEHGRGAKPEGGPGAVERVVATCSGAPPRGVRRLRAKEAHRVRFHHVGAMSPTMRYACSWEATMARSPLRCA